MTISTIDMPDVQAMEVRVTDDLLSVDLDDGRTISVPLAWYPRLLHGTAHERENWEILGPGVHWPDLDEDISVAGLLLGRASGETQASLRRWLDSRNKCQ